MRKDIDRHPERIKNVLLDDGVRKSFLKGASKQDTKVVKAFVDSNSENALKTKPKVSLLPHRHCDLPHGLRVAFFLSRSNASSMS